jgi:erythromycin esterase
LVFKYHLLNIRTAHSYCLAAVIVFTHVVAQGQQTVDSFVEWGSPRIVPTSLLATDKNAANVPQFKALIGNARIVALGEPAHGTHEPLAFRNMLSEYLIEQMGFTALAFESGFTEAAEVNRYILGGSGDLDSVTLNGMTWGFGEFQENRDLIQWLRRYNDDPAHRRKVHFYGIDMSGGDRGDFPHARRSIDAAISLLGQVDTASASSLRQSLGFYLDHFSTAEYLSLSTSERSGLTEQLDRLKSVIKQKKSALVSIGSEEEYERALQDVVVAEQLNNMFAISPPPSRTIPPEGYRVVTARNSAMADNVLWALAQEGSRGRLLLFAHNMHVMNAPLKGGPWEAFRQPPSSMGQFLRSTLGPDLLIIGAAGSASLKPQTPQPGPVSLETELAKLSDSPFILDLRSSTANPAASEWLSTPRPLQTNLRSQMILAPSSAFDAIFFTPILTPVEH